MDQAVNLLLNALKKREENNPRMINYMPSQEILDWRKLPAAHKIVGGKGDPIRKNATFDPNRVFPKTGETEPGYVDAMNPGVKNAILQQQSSQRQQLKKQAAQQIVTNPEVKAKIIKNIPQVAKESGLKQKDIKQVKKFIKDDQKVVEAAEENQQVVDAPTNKKPSVANQFFNAFMNVTPELLGGAIGALFAGDEGFVEGAQQGRQVVAGIQEKEEAARKEQLALQQEADRRSWELSKMDKQITADKDLQKGKLTEDARQFNKELEFNKEKLKTEVGLEMAKINAKSAPLSFQEHLDKLPQESKTKMGFGVNVLNTLDVIERNIQKGNFPSLLFSQSGAFGSLVGASEIENAIDLAAENYGRLQSGGAINKDEEARFKRLLPTAADSKEQAAAKMVKLREMVENQTQITSGRSIEEFRQAGLVKRTTQKRDVEEMRQELAARKARR